jgi:hypothetical protein
VRTARKVEAMRRCVTIAAAVTIATTATVPSSAARGPSIHSTAIRACATSQLTVRVARWFVGLTHTGGYIRFENQTHALCRLTGWPTLVGMTAAGRTTVALRVRSTWYGPYVKGVPVVTLRRGQVAQVAFSGSDLPRPGKATCPSPFRHLRVTPPGNSRAVLLSAWFPPLARYLPSCAGIEVSMVVRPSAFRH